MGTIMRSELSKSNEFYIPKYRYYELKYFCLQFDSMKKRIKSLENEYYISSGSVIKANNTPQAINLVEKTGIEYASLTQSMMDIQQAANETDSIIGQYILKAVTSGLTYEIVNPPCCRNEYYRLYRKFFWLLSKKHI